MFAVAFILIPFLHILSRILYLIAIYRTVKRLSKLDLQPRPFWERPDIMIPSFPPMAGFPTGMPPPMPPYGYPSPPPGMAPPPGTAPFPPGYYPPPPGMHGVPWMPGAPGMPGVPGESDPDWPGQREEGESRDEYWDESTDDDVSAYEDTNADDDVSESIHYTNTEESRRIYEGQPGKDLDDGGEVNEADDDEQEIESNDTE